MKIGFIGAGNMASAIIKGLILNNYASSAEIFITASTPERSQTTASTLQVTAAPSNLELVNLVDIVILAVKPTKMATVLAELTPALLKKQLPLISIASGLTLAKLGDLIDTPAQQKLIRVMPNMNVTIGRSVSAVCGNSQVSQAEIKEVIQLFEAVGSAYEIEEKDFSNFTALAGCSPAFTYLYIDAMSRAGVKHGLPKKLATKIAAEAVLGSAEMVLAAEHDTPWDLIDKVCSPGGTTIAGLVALEEDKFMATVINGLSATIVRDEELKG